VCPSNTDDDEFVNVIDTVHFVACVDLGKIVWCFADAT
jgi:hypothetical protein